MLKICQYETTRQQPQTSPSMLVLITLGLDIDPSQNIQMYPVRGNIYRMPSCARSHTMTSGSCPDAAPILPRHHYPFTSPRQHLSSTAFSVITPPASSPGSLTRPTTVAISSARPSRICSLLLALAPSVSLRKYTRQGLGSRLHHCEAQHLCLHGARRPRFTSKLRRCRVPSGLICIW